MKLWARVFATPRYLLIGLFMFVLGASAIATFLVTNNHQKAQARIQYDSHHSAITMVALLASQATPDSVSVKVGETVQFNTKDNSMHFLTSGEGGQSHEHISGGYESGEFGANEAWKVTFNTKGTYTFHDHNHPGISVLVVVY